MVLPWLSWESLAKCVDVASHPAELMDCQGLLADLRRMSPVPRSVSFVPRWGGYRQVVAGCCEPERRSRTLANWERPDTTGCFGPRPTLTTYPQAVTGCSKPDRRSRALANWDCRRRPRCADSPDTVTICSLTSRRRVLPRNRTASNCDAHSVHAARWRPANIRK